MKKNEDKIYSMNWLHVAFLFFRFFFCNFLFDFLIEVPILPNTLLLNFPFLCHNLAKPLLLAIGPVADILFPRSIVKHSMSLFLSIQITSLIFRSVLP